MPKSMFYLIRQSHTGPCHLSGESATCPVVTGVSPLLLESPPKLLAGTISIVSLLCLESAQTVPTSPARQACDAPHSRALSLLSVPSHMAGTPGSHTKEEMEAVSSLHFIPASAKLTHGRDHQAVTQPLLFACICYPREPGSISLV